MSQAIFSTTTLQQIKQQASAEGMSCRDLMAKALACYLASNRNDIAPSQGFNAAQKTAFDKAYQGLVAETGFSNVSIAELFRVLAYNCYCAKISGCSFDVFTQQIIELSKAGLLVASTGDWSLSNDNEKQYAIVIGTTKRLLIRMKKGGEA